MKTAISELELVEILLLLFLGKSVWESLNSYISDGKIGDDISDVKDRQAYRHIQAKYRNQKSNLITLLMKTEGVLLFQSSHNNLWPIYFVINEMLAEER